MIEAWFDGCCEPVNPGGTAAYGAVIMRDGQPLWSDSKIFFPRPGHERETSNNVAEYNGFLAILKYLLGAGFGQEEIIVHGDSKLVICQMFDGQGYRGKWRILGGYYVPVARECQKLLLKFPRMRAKWVPREQNGLADELSKSELKKAGVKFKIQPE